MLRLVTRIIYVLPIATVGLYATTGVGLLGPQAMAANHILTTKALNSFMNLGEQYFQAHPIYQPSIPAPSSQMQQTPRS